MRIKRVIEEQIYLLLNKTIFRVRALVTGATSGIGCAIALQLARDSAGVIADAVTRVIALPAGERPSHTVVASTAQRQAPQAVNDAVARATQSFFETLDIPLVSIEPPRDDN